MHPAVALSAVGSTPDEAKGELAKAYIMLKPASQVTTAALLVSPIAESIWRRTRFLAQSNSSTLCR
jgi:acyl-coenzyme A synthetase/AMP-(fatty) acid ligase